MATRKCPICNSLKIDFLYKNTLSKIDNFIDLSYSIGVCKKCGMVFAHHLPNKNTYKNHYQNYQKHDTSTYIRDNTSQISINLLKDYIPKNSKILDVGCSNGYGINLLKKEGYKNVIGIEPSPAAKEIAKSLYNIDIQTGFFDKTINIKEIDLFIFSSVIEHISDIKDFLEPLLNSKNNSFVFIAAPNANEFDKITKKEIFGEFSCEHINYFDINSLNNLMLKFSYLPIFTLPITYSNGLKDILALYKKEKIKNKKIQTSFETKENIKKYIEDCQKELDSNLSVFDNHKEIIIYGAGSHTLKFLTFIEKRVKIKYLLEENKNLIGKKIDNYSIFPLEIIKEENVPIFLSTRNFISQMKEKILKINKESKILYFSTYL